MPLLLTRVLPAARALSVVAAAQNTLKDELAVAVFIASSRCAFSEWNGRARSFSEMPVPLCKQQGTAWLLQFSQRVMLGTRADT